MSTAIYTLTIGILGTVGNFLLAWAFACHESLRSPSNLLIANLALTDLGLSLGTFPLFTISSFAEQWVFGKAGCTYYGVSGGLFGMTSIGTMTAISVDRYFSITQWTKWHLTFRRAICWVLGIWLYSFVLVVPPLLGWSSYIIEGVQTSCTFDFLSRRPADIAFTLQLFLIGFILPLCVILVCYTLIVRHVYRHRKMMDAAGFGQLDEEGVPRSRLNSNATSHDGGKDGRLVQRENDLRAAATCFAIVILFCLAWSPYACVALISTFGRPDLISPYVNCLPALFAKASAVYNPFIYALMNDRFRKVVLTMVGCGEKRRWDPQERYRRSPSPAYPHSQGSKRARSSSTMSVSMSLLSTSATTPTGTQPLFKRSSFDESQEDNEAMNHTGDATEREKRGSLLMTSDLSVVHEKGESSAMAAEAEDVFPIHD